MMIKNLQLFSYSVFLQMLFMRLFFQRPFFSLVVRTDGFNYLNATGSFSFSDASCTGVITPNSVVVSPDADPALNAAVLQQKESELALQAATAGNTNTILDVELKAYSVVTVEGSY